MRSVLPLLLSFAAFATAADLPTDHVFAPSSFWYVVLPDTAPRHTNSAALAADVCRQIKAYYGTVALNLESYASPVYVAATGVPVVRVEEWDCQGKKWKDPKLAEQWEAVPIPEHARPAGGTDGEMTIWQPATDTLWEFWQARQTNGRWQACWGGRMTQVSKSDGIFPKGYGTTACGLPFLGGQVTAEELQRGEIRHAIGLALVDTETHSIVSWPANRSDGWNPEHKPNRIPEGLRCRLDPDLDVDSLHLHPIARTIAKAAQRHGFVVWDKAGSVSIRLQNPMTYTSIGRPNPYPVLFNGTPGYAVLKGFPWERLVFLPMNYGKP